MRSIGEIDHPSIKDAEELNVYMFREDRFRLVRRDKFPTSKCLICPKKYHKTYNISVPCKFKTNSWSQFKAHIQKSEKIYGELVAFPVNYKRMPDLSIYHKIRFYGITSEFQTKDKFYLFDLEQKKFIHVERQSLRRLYIANNYCNYCLCGKSVISSSAFISHLSTLESTYYCFLILNDLKENDEKNQRRIDVLVRDFEKRQLKSSRIRANTNLDALKASAGSTGLIKSTEEVRKELDDDESSFEIVKSKLEQLDRFSNDASFNGGDQFVSSDSRHARTSPTGEENKSLVARQIDQSIVPYSRNPLLLQIESAIKRNYDELQDMIQQLENDACRPGLLESLVREQASLLLVKRVENYQNSNHYLSFSKQIDLTANDLNNLLTKYEISNRLRIDKAELCLNLVMKDESGLNIDQSLGAATYDAIGYNTNGGYDSSTQFDTGSIARVNCQNSTAHSSSVYYDCPDANRYSDSNGIRHDASHSSATNCSNSDSIQRAHQTSAAHQSDSNRTGATHLDLQTLTDNALESLPIEPVKPHKPQPPQQPAVKKSELDQSLAYLSKPKLLNFKIPKKPQINSFGHFNGSPDGHSNKSPNRDSYSTPRIGHSSYKSNSSYYGRY